MTRCEESQDRLLAYLYDLLDSDERQALEDHVAGCPGCQAALARAQEQRRLLAAAAKAEFAAVRFQPPEQEPATVSPQHRRSAWVPWAVAAAILLLLGAGGPGGYWAWHYAQDRRQAADLAEACAATQSQIARLETEHQALVARRLDLVQKTQADAGKLDTEIQQKVVGFEKWARERQMNLMVTGPERLQPGAPNEYQISTRNLNNQPVPVNLTARVVDEKKKPVLEQNVASPGEYRLALPADLPLGPHTSLALEILAQREGGPDERVREELPLATPVYVTHVTTDKPMYQPGETVRFRSLTLERFSLRPPDTDFRLAYSITNGNGQEVLSLAGATPPTREGGQPIAGPDGKPLRGVGAGEYPIPPGAPGGDYTLTVREASDRFPAQQRKFLVNAYEKPRLNKELDYTRKAYGPGDEVVAACKANRVEGGPVARQPVTASVQIDGKPYGADGTEGAKPFALQTDEHGAVNVRFKLPAKIERGQASLSVQFRDSGGSPETLVRPIPIVLKKLFVEFFPEGGYVVAGVPNRVYFQVRTTLGKPAELKGRIVDDRGAAAVADVTTLHDDKEPGINQGMGSFAFTPQAGHKYELKIESPVGIEGKYELPTVEADGVVLSAPEGVTAGKEPIVAVVTSAARDRNLLVGAYCRGRLMDHRSVVARKGETTRVELRPAQDAGGVYRVTVFEEQGQGNRRQLVPRAERLVYRKPIAQVILTARPDRKSYVPGDRVRLSLSALNEKEQPAPAVLLVAVVDKSVITLADEKTARSMPTHFFLTTEVRRPEDLEYADVLLGSHPKAPVALDLLLGTQGWRRFAEQNPGEFRQRFREDADRLLLTTGQSAPKATEAVEAEALKLRDDYLAQRTALQERTTEANRQLQEAQSDHRYTDERGRLMATFADLTSQQRGTELRLDQHGELARKTASISLLLAFAVLYVAGVLAAVAGGFRRSALRGWATVGACCLLVAAITVLTPWQLALEEGKHGRAAESQLAMNATAATGAKDMEMPPAAAAAPPNALGEGGMMARMARGGAMPAPAAAPQEDRLGEMQQGQGGAKPGLAGGGAINRAIQLEQLAAPKENDFRYKGEGKNVLHFGAQVNAERAAEVAKPHAELRDGLQDLARRAAGPLPALQDPRAVDKKKADAQFAAKRLAAPEPEQELLLRRQAGLAAADRLAGGAAPIGQIQGAPRMAGRGGAALGGEAKDQFGMLKMMPGDRVGAFGGAMGRANNGQKGAHDLGLLRKLREFPGQQLEFPGRQLALDGAQVLPLAPLVVREYAHHHAPADPSGVRSDFADTLFWQPLLVLPDGKGDVSFDLTDSVTTFQVQAVAHTLDGRLGSLTTSFESRLPFTLEPKLPIEVTAGDRIDLPVTVANNTTERRPVSVRINAQGVNLLGEGEQQLTVDADGRGRRLFRLQPALVEGQAQLSVQAQSEPFHDRVDRTLRVVPEGFPVVASRSDMLEGTARQDVELPAAWIKGTLKCRVQVFPSTLADLQKGLESLLREPGGCFEQTSTTNYPNVLILDYLKESNQAKPEIVRQARTLLASGYQKLTAFECLNQGEHRREGYEWFGGAAPPHEALTAYGLLQFRDMARVYDVDPVMLERTRTYLLSRKDGNGGFRRNPQALDSFGRAPVDITNAYIVWALTESGNDDVAKELAVLGHQAKTSKDPYFLSLVATSLLNRGKRDEGVALLKAVAAAQKDDGHLDAAQTSITSSGGRDLQIETTALAILGWLKANRPAEFTTPIQKAVQWIGKQRGGYGGFGSTQSTILALKAIIAYTNANKKTAEAGELRLTVGDQPAAKIAFPAGVQEALILDLPGPEKHLKSGKNPVRVEITGKNTFPFTLSWSYQVRTPASAEGCPVRLATHLDRTEVTEGETVHLTVAVENAQDKGQGMAVAIVGLPAGLTLPEDLKQLKDHARLRDDGKARGLIDAWETRGREVILYWRDLAPRQKIEVPIDLICRVPGEYRGPASRGYLYYNADHKHWIEPLAVTIRAKGD